VMTDSAGKTASATFVVTASQTATPSSITLTPSSVSPGSQFTINAFDFTPYGSVKMSEIMLNGVPCTGPTYTLDGTGKAAITITLSTSQTPGNYAVVVIDSAGKKASASLTVTAPPITTPPATITITPASGSPGSTFTISGRNLTPNGTVKSADVLFNGMPSTGMTYPIDAAGNFSCTLTLNVSQPTGAYPVKVTDSSGRSGSAVFTVTPPPPAITLSPTSGIPGSTLTISGRNFAPYEMIKWADVLFNGVPCTGTQFSVDGSGSFSATFNLHPTTIPGTYSLQVTDSSGKSGSAFFTVTPP
jgi:hypothetical protein